MMTNARTRPGLPPIAVGTMYFGTTVPTERALRILDEAYDIGARCWDTANNYAFWMPGGTGDESEQVLGAWLGRHPDRRDDITVATKVGARPCPGGHDLTDALGLSPSAIRTQVRDSLSRLCIDHIDLLYAHVDDPAVPLEETIGALEQLCEQGLVREIGASNLTAPRLRDAVAAGGSDTGYRYLQQRFSFLRPAPEADLAPHVLLDEEVVAECETAGIVMLGYSPLLSGAYTRADRPLPDGYATQANRAALDVLDDVAANAGLDAGQTTLAWMAQRDRPVTPVVGVSSVDQLRSAVIGARTPLAADALVALDSARMM